MRRTKTNRREMVREVYSACDFDFALAYIEEMDCFYVLPVAASSTMHKVQVAVPASTRCDLAGGSHSVKGLLRWACVPA